MNVERLNHHPTTPLIESILIDTAGEKEKDFANGTEIIDSDSFDLNEFFGVTAVQQHSGSLGEINSVEQPQSQKPDLLATLKTDARESVAALTTGITATTFKTGVSLTTNVLSTLSKFVGSCGLFCTHGLSAVGNLGNLSASGTAFGLPNLSQSAHNHSHGHDHGHNSNHPDLTKVLHSQGIGNSQLRKLSSATGIPTSDLSSGKYSERDLISALTMLASDVGAVFSQPVSMLMNSMFGFIGAN